MRPTDFDESEARAEYLAALRRLHLAAAARLERCPYSEVRANVLRADCDELAESLTVMRLCVAFLAIREGRVS